MYSLDFIKDNYEVLRDYIQLKKIDTDLDYIFQLTLDRSRIIKDIQHIHQSINSLNKAYLDLKPGNPTKEELHIELKELSKRKKHIKKSLKDIEKKLHELLLTLPNIPNISLYHHHSSPLSEDNLHKEWYPAELPQDPPHIIPHYDMAHKLRIYDHNYTKKISAPKFMLYLPNGSKLISYISRKTIDFLSKQGFQRLFISEVLDREIVKTMGYLHEDKEMFLLKDESLQLSPSGHIGILNMLSKMNLHKSTLPLKLFAISNCFRKEIGGYGKDNRGLLRMYQFLKNDALLITDPDESYDIYDSLIRTIEKFIQSFEIPYRIINLSYKNTPFTSSKTLLFESYLPSLKKWINLLSVSNTEEFLSRRISLQFRHIKKKQKDYPHIIQWSGPSIERIIALILEHRQYQGNFDFNSLFD